MMKRLALFVAVIAVGLAAAVAGLEERLAERLQNEADAVQAQFAQVHETMATNLTMVLAAIGERR